MRELVLREGKREELSSRAWPRGERDGGRGKRGLLGGGEEDYGGVVVANE